MHKWWLLLALLFAPAAHATPGHVANAFLTLAGAYAGCAGGGLLGMGVYGAIDPYQTDDGLEWVLVGIPAGCGIGAPIGATALHMATGGVNGGRVLLVSGVLGVAGAALAVATPGLYQDFEDERFAVAYVTGFTLAAVGSPVAAFMTALFSKGRHGRKKDALTLAPLLDRRQRGVVVGARF